MYLLLSLFVVLAFGKAPLFIYDEVIEGQYIVIYHPNTPDLLQLKHQAPLGKNVFANYNITENFMGYAAYLTKAEVELIRDDPIVAEVHPDTPVSIYGRQQTCNNQQTNARSWGICRCSHYGAIGNNGLTTFKHDDYAGTGVDMYIIDTGIRITHTEFTGRAVWGANYVDSSNTDGNGHGTHCAGTAAGATVGVARYGRPVAVKVLNAQGSGTNSGVISGVNYCCTTYRQRQVPSVASMSLGGAYNTAMNNAVAALVSCGVTTAVAAGNDNSNACNYSPASTPSAICVGATSTNTQGDTRSTFSNWGNCVHMFAPGSNIFSSSIASNTAYSTLSGTSMACPHVAGLAADVLSREPHLTPAGVKAQLISGGNQGYISNPDSPNNVIGYNQC